MKKSFITGTVFGMLIASTTGVLAANTDTVKEFITGAYINNEIHMVINDQTFEMKNKPINHDFTNYFPIRDIAEAVGMEVGWDEATRTIYLTDKVESPVSSNSNNIEQNNMSEHDNADSIEEIYEIIDREKNISYDYDNNTGRYLMSDEEFTTYNKIDTPELRLFFCQMVMSQFIRQHPTLQSEKIYSFTIEFIYEDKVRLVFKDEGEGNKEKDFLLS